MNYLIKSGNYIKVGFSKIFKKRLSAYKVMNPDIVVLDCYDAGTLRTEKLLHRLMIMYRHSGEWFHYNEDTIKIWNEFTGHNITYECPSDKKDRLIKKLKDMISQLREDIDIANYKRIYICKLLVNGIELKFLSNVAQVYDFIKKFY